MAGSTSGDRVIEIVDGDRQDLIDLCLRLGNARDYAGDEREVAEAVEAWLAEAGIETRLQRIGETSANAIGILRGTDHEDPARRFIDFMLSRPFQEALPYSMYVFPVNLGAELPVEFSAHAQIPSQPVTISAAAIAAGRQEWTQAWLEAMLR